MHFTIFHAEVFRTRPLVLDSPFLILAALSFAASLSLMVRNAARDRSRSRHESELSKDITADAEHMYAELDISRPR